MEAQAPSVRATLTAVDQLSARIREENGSYRVWSAGAKVVVIRDITLLTLESASLPAGYRATLVANQVRKFPKLTMLSQ